MRFIKGSFKLEQPIEPSDEERERLAKLSNRYKIGSGLVFIAIGTFEILTTNNRVTIPSFIQTFADISIPIVFLIAILLALRLGKYDMSPKDEYETRVEVSEKAHAYDVLGISVAFIIIFSSYAEAISVLGLLALALGASFKTEN